MTSPVFKNRAGLRIDDWQDWTRPKRDHHWKAGRSAMELARSWFTSQTPQCPPEIRDLLATSLRTANVQFSEGHPEFPTALPERGEGRNHVLLLRGSTGSEALIVCVEAKVDEPFDKKIGERWQEEMHLRAGGKATKAPERIQALLGIVFGATAQPDQQPWRDLRYQLLTAVAGTLIQATKEQVPLGVFVVHEFQTHSADTVKLKTNADDYAAFVTALFSAPSVSSGQMYGPLTIQSGRYLPQSVEMLVGKAVCQWKP